jgi:AraC family transcriptional regulator of adaptative response / DNA-3-methyladenine glycosylase II
MGDLGVLKALSLPGKKLTEKAALTASQRWRPWRSYATMLLWKSLANQGG